MRMSWEEALALKDALATVYDPKTSPPELEEVYFAVVQVADEIKDEMERKDR